MDAITTQAEKLKAARKKHEVIKDFVKHLKTNGVEVKPEIVASYFGVNIEILLTEILLA